MTIPAYTVCHSQLNNGFTQTWHEHQISRSFSISELYSVSNDNRLQRQQLTKHKQMTVYPSKDRGQLRFHHLHRGSLRCHRRNKRQADRCKKGSDHRRPHRFGKHSARIWQQISQNPATQSKGHQTMRRPMKHAQFNDTTTMSVGRAAVNNNIHSQDKLH